MSTRSMMKKEAARVRNKFSLDELRFYCAKTEARLALIKQAGIFAPEDIIAVQETIEDYNRRIARRERTLVKKAQQMMQKQATSYGLTLDVIGR